MGKVTGFLEIDRQDRKYRPASDRIRNFREFIVPLPEQVIRSGQQMYGMWNSFLS